MYVSGFESIKPAGQRRYCVREKKYLHEEKLTLSIKEDVFQPAKRAIFPPCLCSPARQENTPLVRDFMAL